MIGPLPHPLKTRTLPTAEIWKGPSRPGPPAEQPPRPRPAGDRASFRVQRTDINAHCTNFRLRSCVSVPPSFARLRACQLHPAAPGLVSTALPTQPLRRGHKTRASTTQSRWKDSGPTLPPRSSSPAGGAVATSHLSPCSRLLLASSQSRSLGALPLLAASLLPIGRGRAGPSNGTRRW